MVRPYGEGLKFTLNSDGCWQAPNTTMDYITSFDIRLEKDVYYAGEPLTGCVVLENTENIKIRGIRVLLRGKAHVQLKVMKSGERKTLKDDQYLLDEKIVIWGKDKSEPPDAQQILPRGMHTFNFAFQLPQCQMPCSLETRMGTIRYYVKCIIDIPYASSPQGIKYFSLIGPHIDCMEEKYLAALCGADYKKRCFRCCQRGQIGIRCILERTAYCSGENLRIKAWVDNSQDFTINLNIRLFQIIEYRVEKGVLGETKTVTSTAVEFRSSTVAENSQVKFDSMLEQHPIKIPVVPPTMVGVCRLMQIYYTLKVSVEDERKNETLEMEFPVTIATVPYRSPQTQLYSISYDFCVDYVEGGRYISPEFRLGQVYDGNGPTTVDEETPPTDQIEEEEDIILYRPVYVKVMDKPKGISKITKELLDQKLSESQADLDRALKVGSQKLSTKSAGPSGEGPSNGLEQQKLLEDSGAC
uniref:Arrestin_C domain-containing protein n=1 Tax=Panagrellus redivivus TaxID=6233 RepID=A0A7E4W6C0_PANRE